MRTLKERLQEVMAAMRWTTPREVASVAGVTRSAAAQWLGKGSKLIHSIGNMEAAERLERATGYRALWIAKGIGAKRVDDAPSESFGGDAPDNPSVPWPLPEVSESKVRALSEGDRVRLETAFLITAAQLGLDVKKD